jgi:hypothetical protein
MVLPRPRRRSARNGKACWHPTCATVRRYMGLVLIMDSRHPLTELDLQMLGWFAPTGKPIHVLLVQGRQADSPGTGARTARGSGSTEGRWRELAPATVFKLEEVRSWEAEAVLAAGSAWKSATEAPPPSACQREERPAKKRSAIGWSARSGGDRRQASLKKSPRQRGGRGQTCLTGIRHPLREVKREMASSHLR